MGGTSGDTGRRLDAGPGPIYRHGPALSSGTYPEGMTDVVGGREHWDATYEAKGTGGLAGISRFPGSRWT